MQAMTSTISYKKDEPLTATQITAQRWIELTRRRLQVYPAKLSSNNVLLTNQEVPGWLVEPIFARFKQLDVFEKSPHGMANHVLINQYKPGEGIMPHEDGDAYAPITATVSLGAPIVLDLYEKRPSGEREAAPKWRVLQEERSLLVTRGNAYRDLIHGISENEQDDNLKSETIVNWHLLRDSQRFQSGTLQRETRTSLTCRDVLKVSKLGNRLFGNKR